MAQAAFCQSQNEMWTWHTAWNILLWLLHCYLIIMIQLSHKGVLLTKAKDKHWRKTHSVKLIYERSRSWGRQTVCFRQSWVRPDGTGCGSSSGDGDAVRPASGHGQGGRGLGRRDAGCRGDVRGCWWRGGCMGHQCLFLQCHFLLLCSGHGAGERDFPEHRWQTTEQLFHYLRNNAKI